MYNIFNELCFMFSNDFINDFRCFINAKQVEKEYNFNALKECLKLWKSRAIHILFENDLLLLNTFNVLWSIWWDMIDIVVVILKVLRYERDTMIYWYFVLWDFELMMNENWFNFSC